MATAVKVENLSKAYQLGQFGTGTLTKDLERWWALARGKEDPFLKIGEANDRSIKGKSNVVWSLKDVNLEIQQGKSVGIIGKNGAGKSTLLKILSRVTAPTSGSLKLKGRVASLLEVGTGFHPELTGRENIYLNGAILGMNRKEINKKFDAIVDFSGVERYIDTPVKRYSSGMYVRLAFAVAAHLESEILIVDEVLAVGDAEFQKKCLSKMGDISQGEGRSILFVSHNLAAVTQLCQDCVILEKGMIQFSGKTSEGIENYLKADSVTDFHLSDSKDNDKDAFISFQCLKNSKGDQVNSFGTDDDITLVTNIRINNFDPRYTFGVSMTSGFKGRIFTIQKTLEELNGRGKEGITVEITIQKNTIPPGNYFWQSAIHIPNVQYIYLIEETCMFSVFDTGSHALAKYTGTDPGCLFLNNYSLLAGDLNSAV